MKALGQMRLCAAVIVLILSASLVVACSASHHGAPSRHGILSNLSASPIRPTIIPSRSPSSPASADNFKTTDGKIRCYSPLMTSGITEDQTGLWCFSDSNGLNGQDCQSSPGPAAVHMPIDGMPVYYRCSAKDVKEAIFKQSHLATISAGSVVDIGSTTCHIEANEVSVLCAGYIEYGFSISSAQGSTASFYNNCKTTDTKVKCTNADGKPVS